MELFYTSITVLCLVPLFLVLTFRVIGYRRAHRISIGDNGDPECLRRVRMHANFVEYAPFALILMLLCELMGATPAQLIPGGALLVLGRYFHAFGISTPQAPMSFRVGGMIFTIFSIVTFALSLLKILIFSSYYS